MHLEIKASKAATTVRNFVTLRSTEATNVVIVIKYY